MLKKIEKYILILIPILCVAVFNFPLKEPIETDDIQLVNSANAALKAFIVILLSWSLLQIKIALKIQRLLKNKLRSYVILVIINITPYLYLSIWIMALSGAEAGLNQRFISMLSSMPVISAFLFYTSILSVFFMLIQLGRIQRRKE